MKRFLIAAAIVVFSAGLSYAAGDGDHSGQMKDFLWRILNFTIFTAIIYLLARKAVRGFFSGRRRRIRESIEEAERFRDESLEKLREYETKLEKASQEIVGIAEMIRSQGEREKEKIIDDAKIAAEKMKQDAGTRIDQEFKKAVAELKEEATRLSVEMAEEILKNNIDEKDHEAMVDDFLNRMVTRN
ncbi:MAG: ATP synthase F0 subunit B [Syntrophales bacterium]|jgi:F-type H+-transporting ATPase subunit b|nr:ATP synthase F0 subunit B [Syntrophales bacterium]MCK9528129.1 ATP synthase F0 subunit B [Syntrophales bacterium]MDX9921098.1 ATP synthase F0 subunit B [Syntrophales bacterium]